jgi:hypothetical protein
MALATVVVAVVVFDGFSKRWRGLGLVGLYGVLVAGVAFAGDR